jgi:hypothetical protein
MADIVGEYKANVKQNQPSATTARVERTLLSVALDVDLDVDLDSAPPNLPNK